MSLAEALMRDPVVYQQSLESVKSVFESDKVVVFDTEYDGKGAQFKDESKIREVYGREIGTGQQVLHRRWKGEKHYHMHTERQPNPDFSSTVAGSDMLALIKSCDYALAI